MRARDPLALAQLAQSIERDDLGIVAGLQDRAVQSFGSPVLVDVAGATPVVTKLAPEKPVEFLVAWLPGAAADSGDYHRRLSTRADQRGMDELADIGRAAAKAFVAGDADQLVTHMRASAEVRSRVAPLPPAHDRLAAAVQRAGMWPNSAGSGGAVVAVIADEGQRGIVAGELASIGALFVCESFG